MNTITELYDRSIQAYDSGDIDLSLELAERLVFLYKAIEGHYILGLIYAVKENWLKSLENCLKVYNFSPNVSDNLNRIGVAYCQLGNYDEGLEYLKKGISLGDENCSGNYFYWIKYV